MKQLLTFLLYYIFKHRIVDKVMTTGDTDFEFVRQVLNASQENNHFNEKPLEKCQKPQWTTSYHVRYQNIC